MLQYVLCDAGCPRQSEKNLGFDCSRHLTNVMLRVNLLMHSRLGTTLQLHLR